MPRRTRCTWTVNRGTRCTNNARTKKGLCKMHYRISNGKPGKVYLSDVDTYLKSVNTHENGHATLSLRSVLEWVINKASVDELETLELVTKNTK